MQNIISLMFYLAFGLLVYLLAYGSVDWSDEWVYVIVMLWPFALLWWSLLYIVLFVAVLALIPAVIIFYDYLTSRA
jgi:hypothetical protein